MRSQQIRHCQKPQKTVPSIPDSLLRGAIISKSQKSGPTLTQNWQRTKRMKAKVEAKKMGALIGLPLRFLGAQALKIYVGLIRISGY